MGNQIPFMKLIGEKLVYVLVPYGHDMTPMLTDKREDVIDKWTSITQIGMVGRVDVMLVIPKTRLILPSLTEKIEPVIQVNINSDLGNRVDVETNHDMWIQTMKRVNIHEFYELVQYMTHTNIKPIIDFKKTEDKSNRIMISSSKIEYVMAYIRCLLLHHAEIITDHYTCKLCKAVFLARHRADFHMEERHIWTEGPHCHSVDLRM